MVDAQCFDETGRTWSGRYLIRNEFWNEVAAEKKSGATFWWRSATHSVPLTISLELLEAVAKYLMRQSFYGQWYVILASTAN